MPRLMSVAHTVQAVLERRKSVSRRLGWRFLTPGDQLTLCRKVMGRKPGEPLVRLAEVEVLEVSRFPLNWISQPDVKLEGFPDWTPEQFVEFFTANMRCAPDQEVTRIRWRYMDPPTAEETQKIAEITADLRSRGYVDIEEHRGLHVGARVCHRNERYYDAIAYGTGNVVALLEKPDSGWSHRWGMPDVEMVVLRDKPRLTDSRLMQVAQYHVDLVKPELRVR